MTDNNENFNTGVIDSNNKVVTRFAPSPTGFLHIGGIRTALYAWAYAKKNNGTFILRIEDTDKAREVTGSIEHIIESLKWIGIDWSEGPDIGGPNAPYKQSERLDSYLKYANILIEKGLAYADPYTEEEVDAFRKKADEEKRPFLYRDHRPENPPLWDKTMPLRFKVPNIKSYEWEDSVRGHLKAGPEALDDFILIKSDGYPTYNFAHIIDDLEMGVTHIMRADEFISSTPKFISLYEALEIKRPIFVTLPPIMGPDGKKKLGKRDGAKDFLEYRNEGYLPEAMMNFLAFIGWNPGGNVEIITPAEFINLFDIKQIHISGGGFNVVKLDWIQKEHMKKLSEEEYLSLAIPFVPNISKLKNFNRKELNEFILRFRDKITKFSDLKFLILDSITTTQGDSFSNDILQVKSDLITDTKIDITIGRGPSDYLFPSNDLILDNKEDEIAKLIIPKNLDKKIVIDYLNKIIDYINIYDWDKIVKKDDDSELWKYASIEGRSKVLWPLRIALSAKQSSLDPFEIMTIIGKEATLKRINNSIKFLCEPITGTQTSTDNTQSSFNNKAELIVEGH